MKKIKTLAILLFTVFFAGCTPTIAKEALTPRMDPIVFSAQKISDKVTTEITNDKVTTEIIESESEAEIIPETGSMWTTSSLNMRSGPGTTHKKMTTIPKESQVSVSTKTKSGWYKVTYNRKTGYVSGKYLTSTKPVKKASTVSPAPKASITASLTSVSGERWTTSALNIRKGPGVEHIVQKSIPKGTKVTIQAKSANGWYQISYMGVTGFVSGKYLSEKAPAKASAQTSKSPSSKYEPMRLYLPDRTLVYQNGGKANGQSIIDANHRNVSTWGGAEIYSGSDDKNTHFIGHNTNAFKGIWNYAIGNLITVTDASSVPTTYRITKMFVVTDNGEGVNDGVDYYKFIASIDGGEVITLQTCKTSTTNWIIRAEKVN